MASTEVATIPLSDYAIVKFDAEDFEEIVTENLAGENLSARDLPQVKVPGAGAITWEVPSLAGPQGVAVIEGVILAKKKTRQFYPAEFKGGNERPSCSSADAKIGWGNPGATAEDPHPEGVDPVRTVCADCPNSQWGSGEGNAQACSERLTLFVLRPDALLPIVIDLPPTSLGAAKEYLLGLSNEAKSFKRVVTKISLVKERSAGGIDFARAVFAVGEDVPADVQERMNAVADAIGSAFESYQPPVD